MVFAGLERYTYDDDRKDGGGMRWWNVVEMKTWVMDVEEKEPWRLFCDNRHPPTGSK